MSLEAAGPIVRVVLRVCLFVGILGLAAVGFAESSRAAPRLELLEVQASVSVVTNRAKDVSATALCPAGSVAISAANAGGPEPPKALVPVRVGERTGWQAVWDNYGDANGRRTVTAICGRGAEGLEVAAAGNGLQPPIRVTAAAGPGVTIHVVRARTPLIYVSQPYPLRAVCPAGTSAVGYGWRWGATTPLENVMVLRSVGVQQVGARQAVQFSVSATQETDQTYNRHVFELYASCIGTSGLSPATISLQKSELAPKAPAIGAVVTHQLACPAGTTALTFPFFSITNAAYASAANQVNTTVTGMRPKAGGKGATLEIFPVSDLATDQNGPRLSFQQPCARTKGWSIDASRL